MGYRYLKTIKTVNEEIHETLTKITTYPKAKYKDSQQNVHRVLPLPEPGFEIPEKAPHILFISPPNLSNFLVTRKIQLLVII